jgi:hypothetical protein
MKIFVLLFINLLAFCSCRGSSKGSEIFINYDEFSSWFVRSLKSYSETSREHIWSIHDAHGELDKDASNTLSVMKIFEMNKQTSEMYWLWTQTSDRRARILIIAGIICVNDETKFEIPPVANPWDLLDLFSKDEKEKRLLELKFVFENRQKIAGLLYKHIVPTMDKSDNRIKMLYTIATQPNHWNPVKKL